MSFATRTWDRMSLQARLLAILVPVAIAGAVRDGPGDVLLGPPFLDFLGANLPLVRFVVAAVWPSCC